MARKPRIEYPGAVYHLLSRGDREEAIFRDETDYQVFLETLGQTCTRTGWMVHAYVLMGNHYHLLVETPEPNLVAGMKWFQGTYTQRFNRRHRESGHLFQGRYKALVVETGSRPYFTTVSTYIHLNPARTKAFDLRRGRLEDFAWSSYPAYLRPSLRPQWLCVERVLNSLDLTDDRKGRVGYRRYLADRITQMASSKEPGQWDPAWSGIRRGWYLGSASFLDQLMGRLDGVRSDKRRGSLSGEAMVLHDERRAEQLLKEGLTRLGLAVKDLDSLAKGSDEKRVLAWHIRKSTTVSNGWLSEHLRCGHPANIPGYLRSARAERGRRVKQLKAMILKSED